MSDDFDAALKDFAEIIGRWVWLLCRWLFYLRYIIEGLAIIGCITIFATEAIRASGIATLVTGIDLFIVIVLFVVLFEIAGLAYVHFSNSKPPKIS